MGKIADTVFRDWKNGDTVNALDYKQEREILRVAINDTHDRYLADESTIQQELARLEAYGYEGDYDATITYGENAFVSHNNGLWIALQETTGNEPVEGLYWESLLDFSSIIANAEQATTDATDAATYANDKGLYAANKGLYASEQGDYAKTEADRLVNTDVSSLDAKIGPLTDLTTVNKDSVVESVNEVNKQVNDARLNGITDVGYGDLEERLNEDYANVTQELAQKAEQSALDTTNEKLVQKEEKADANKINDRMNNYRDTNELLEYYSKTLASTDTTYSVNFPTIELYEGTIYIAFRLGGAHASLDGEIRVINSTDGGLTWSAQQTVLAETDRDFRDPQLIEFNGNLVMRAFVRDSSDSRRLVFTQSVDGVNWDAYTYIDPPTGFEYAGASGSMIVQDGMLVSTAYTYPHPCSVFIVTTTDMTNFNVHLSLDASDYGFGASESTIAYLDGAYRIYCRPSPNYEVDWFACRLNSTDFKVEYIEHHQGDLQGPRSLQLDDKKTLLTSRGRDDYYETTIITKADRNGRLDNHILKQPFSVGDWGYLDLKTDGTYIYGVYYEEREDGSYRLIFVRYSLNEISDLGSQEQATIEVFDPNGTPSYNKVFSKYVSYTHDSVATRVRLSIVIGEHNKKKILNSINITPRCDDSNFYIAKVYGIEYVDDRLAVDVDITNLAQVASGSTVYLYYNIFFNYK